MPLSPPLLSDTIHLGGVESAISDPESEIQPRRASEPGKMAPPPCAAIRLHVGAKIAPKRATVATKETTPRHEVVDARGYYRWPTQAALCQGLYGTRPPTEPLRADRLHDAVRKVDSASPHRPPMLLAGVNHFMARCGSNKRNLGKWLWSEAPITVLEPVLRASPATIESEAAQDMCQIGVPTEEEDRKSIGSWIIHVCRSCDVTGDVL